MTSRQHQDWINRGKPDSGLALPLQLLANTLSAAGYTVYVYPNDAHLDAPTPEDHTYYSETGWPGTSPKWWRHAIDIMPPPAGSKLPSLQTIGLAIFNACQSGQITWVKYMNWPSDGNLSRAVQDRWEPNHSRGSSSDTGHIHLSSITGVETLDSSFNPLTSVVVTGSTTPGAPAPFIPLEGPVFYAYTGDGGPTSRWFVCNGQWSVEVPKAREADIRTLRDEGLIDFVTYKAGPNKDHNSLDWPRSGWSEAFGRLVPLAAAPAEVTITDAQLSALAADVVAGLAAQAPAAQLTAADVASELARRLQA